MPRKTLRFALIPLVFLGACTRTIEHDRPVTVKVPVAQPCAGERPARPAALKDTTPDWNTLDVRQKAAVVARQGLSWQTYGEQLDAATAACP
jgi:hypothetical protein